MSQTTQEQIRLLKAIHRATCSSTGGSTSDATEATLQAILAELRDNNSLNEMLVTDTAGVVHIRRTTVNADTGVITTEYLDPQTQAVSVPTFPIVASSSDDYEFIETCYEAANVKYKKIDWFASGNITVPATTIWFNTVDGTYSSTPPVGATPCIFIANVPISCGDAVKGEILGYNRLRNGDFEESTGVGASSVPNVGWTTTYTPVDILDTAPIGSYLLYEGDLGAYTNGNYSSLSTSKAIALKSLGTGTPPLFEFTTEFEFGKTYRLQGAVAYFVEFGTVGVVQSSDELSTLIIPQPAIEGFFEQFIADFTWIAPTGQGTIKFAQSGLSTTDPIIIFDNLQVREVTSVTQTETLTSVDYTETVKAVINQVVKTTNCNDDRRDDLLVDIADVITQSSTKLEQALNNNAADWELLEVQLVDDVANDGTGAIIPYSELYNVSSTGVRTLIATVDEKGADYTLLGTRRSASEIGVDAKTGANQFVLRGPGTWSPTEAMQQFMYAVINIAAPLTPPTYRGSNNVVSELFNSESSEYTVLTGTDKFDVANIQITANTGDIIKISYNEITI